MTIDKLKPQPSTLLNVDQAAVELALDSTQTMRLIGKGRLAATWIGDDDNGSWRITSAALESYVASGAKDARCPDYIADDQSAWFDDSSIAGYARGFFDAATAAVEEQAPSLEAVKVKFDAGDMLVFDAKTTGAIAELLNKPLPAGGVGIASVKDGRFANWWMPYVVGLMRDAAADIVRKQPGGLNRTLFDGLFGDGPDAFQQIASAAYQQVAARYISTSVGPYRVASGNTQAPWATATVRFPLSALLTPGKRNGVVDLAF